MTHELRSTAEELQERAAYWLMRHEEPDWSEQESAAFEAWLAESMSHKAAYWRLEYGWRKADRIAVLGRPRNQELHVRHSLWVRMRPALAVAASVLVIILLAADQFAMHSTVPVVQARFSTSVGGYQRIPLKDGSQIELNTATALRVAISDAQREVWLDRGEVYFEVFHAKARPFVVHAGSHAVTVLGTKFLVRIEDDRLVVGVVEGRVRIEDAQRTKQGLSTVVTSGDMAIAQGESTMVVANAANRVAGSLSWRDGMITLDRVTVAEAAAEFNRYNDRKIIVADPQAMSVHVGGTFHTSSVDDFVYLLRKAYGLRVEIQNDER